MKNSNDTTGNRIRDHPICSAMPQPTAPPRGPLLAASGSNILPLAYSVNRQHI